MEILLMMAAYSLTGALGNYLAHKILGESLDEQEPIFMMVFTATGPGALVMAGIIYIDNKLTGFTGP